MPTKRNRRICNAGYLYQLCCDSHLRMTLGIFSPRHLTAVQLIFFSLLSTPASPPTSHALCMWLHLWGATVFYAEHNSKNRKGSFRDVTWRILVGTWRLICWLKLSTNFPCLPRETGKAGALEINPSEEEKSSIEYMQKKILHRKRCYTETENNTLP